jgi:serine/threonine-protein kinase RsbW
VTAADEQRAVPVADAELACPARPECLDEVHGLLASLWDAAPDVALEDRMMFELAVVEIAGNVVEHAGGDSAGGEPGPVQLVLRVAVHRDRLEARLHDDGTVALVDLARAQLPADPLAESGRGLALALASGRLTYAREGGANVWCLVRARA